MKLNALILLLSGVLNSVATILFGKEESRIMEEKDEQRTLVYVALKTLRNAETYAQVLDAIGFFSEAMDFVEESHVDLVEQVDDLKTWVAELQGDKKNSKDNLNKEVVAHQKALTETQKALALTRQQLKETRQVNEQLNNLVGELELRREGRVWCDNGAPS